MRSSQCTWVLSDSQPHSPDTTDRRPNSRQDQLGSGGGSSENACRSRVPEDARQRRRPASGPDRLPVLSQSCGSTERKRSWVSTCQHQRRLRARSPNGLRASGSTGRTIKRRIARTGLTYRRTLDGTGFLLSSARGLQLVVYRAQVPRLPCANAAEAGGIRPLPPKHQGR